MTRLLAWCAVLVILQLCRGGSGEKPKMKPEADEIQIPEGSQLELNCFSPRQLKFVYPKDVEEAITTSTPEVNQREVEYGYEAIFRRTETLFGDTGWYGCAEEDVIINNEEHDEPDVRWIYVYVTSNNSVFAQVDTFISLREVSGGSAIIPCRPTSPNYPVVLIGNDDSEVELDDRVSFDPKVGFVMKEITLKDSGYYKCTIKDEDQVHELNYHLLIVRKQNLNEPKIHEDTLRHVTRGQELRVNCTIDVDADIQYVFNWSTPQRSSRITTRQYRRTIGANMQRTTSELIINDITDDDEGEYTCIITTFYDSKRTSKFIIVYDPDVKYINLTSQDEDRHYQRKYGDRVQWVVYVDAYPQPQLTWFNTRGEKIGEGWTDPERSKYAVNATQLSTILRINRLDVNDMGVYILQATNDAKMESLNFTLDVIAKPITVLDKIEAYYSPKQKAEIFCHVATFPAPNITWSFLNCPNYPSYEGSWTSPLPDAVTVSKYTSFTSKVTMTIEMTGHVSCEACNNLGCDIATETIYVSDGNGGFGILEPKGKIVEGDDVSLICAASIYNYTNFINWLDEEEQPIQETERLTIVKEKSPFTYRAVLRIKNVQKSDAKYYTCSGKTVDGSIEYADYTITVQDPRAPFFTKTNMNQSDAIFDLRSEGHKTVILKCYVEGMPEPNITWYKDDTVISGNSQFWFLYNKQELRIKYLLERDSGKYTCKAENRLGMVETYQQIVIKGKEISKTIIASVAVVVIVCVILMIYFFIKMRREKIMRKELMEAGLVHFEEGALECLNPVLTVDDQAELLPYDKKWEFPRERLKLGKQLGCGAFGVVMKARAHGISEEEPVTTVAVKMVRRTTEPAYIRALASELKIMVHLGKHLNVVNLLGACTKNISKRELMVIVEYCRYGNLHNFLLRHREDFIDQIDPASGNLDPTIGHDLLTRTASGSYSNRLTYAALSFSRSPSVDSDNGNRGSVPVMDSTGLNSQSISMSPDGSAVNHNSSQPGWRSNYRGDYKYQNMKPICTQDLLSWAFQVARGMEYLSHRKVLHGDLAARNILLAENGVVKICDFGLAKTMYKDDNYKKKGDGPLPIKWMAIESIRDRVFSTQSDIWSFGIVLWEFFTLAETPYPGMEAEKLYQKLIEGYRMEQPEYCTKEVYQIMLRCWRVKPNLRPTFTELADNIGDLLEDDVRMRYIDLNEPYVGMNKAFLEDGKSDYLTMMSAPDHTALSSPTHDYVNSQSPVSEDGSRSYICMSPVGRLDESDPFSPRPILEKSHFEFPPSEKIAFGSSDCEDNIELAPILRSTEEDGYLKPINVAERRAEFANRREEQKKLQRDNQNDRLAERDSGYCNAPRNMHLIDLNIAQNDEPDGGTSATGKYAKQMQGVAKENIPAIVRNEDNYVNMPKQKSDLRKDTIDSFSNPSYVMLGGQQIDEAKA
ncbi:vascular endothelial growth factor receptor 1 isoform X2 [Orussus abietinus]|uniref:vascular endothelial growth factor receptor 1 isoform X2 n=1 Tax=Orussus abietinus TaxID=222816 RepID=UPI000626BEF6|nr:vascular endothelial growth factor receptor 1 isoform X2 [Orussus abietinus]